MKKQEAETAIRQLCGVWAAANGIPRRPDFQPSFSGFKGWMIAEGYGRYFSFRSLVGAEAEAETWFDDEFGQTWRN